MSTVKRLVSMREEDNDFLNDNSISLSKFVRNSIKNMKENSQTTTVKPFSESKDPI